MSRIGHSDTLNIFKLSGNANTSQYKVIDTILKISFKFKAISRQMTTIYGQLGVKAD